jgi:hypothetical protein
VSKPFDTTLKTLIDGHVGEWAAFLAARAGLPAGPAEVLDTDLSTTLQADRLFRVHAPAPFTLHLELESTGRLGIPVELLRYNVAALGVTGPPVHSVLVLLRPKANATDQTGLLELTGADGRPYHTFRYTVVRVWQESVEAFLAAGPGLAPLAVLTNEAAADLDVAFERFRDRLKQPDVPGNVAEVLFGATFVLSGLRYDEAQVRALYERLSMTLEDSTTYQWILQKGEAKGQAQGEARGRLAEVRGMVARLGARRFGPPPAVAQATLDAIADRERLERIAEHILDAAGWDDLLATP